MKLQTLNVILGAKLGNQNQPRWTSAAKSDVGCVRKINEDSFLNLPDFGIWCVADGMGGHQCGDVASQDTVDALKADDDFLNLSFSEKNEWVKSQVLSANAHLRSLADSQGSGQIIGTTLVCLVVDGNQYSLHWVGDSRIYRLRDNEFTQVTHDHSHVAELVERGLISADEAENHPMANVLTRAIGAHDALEVDQVVADVQPGDKFLLCSDGLTKELSDPEICDILASAEAQDAAQALIHSALVRNARDNVTALVVRIS